MITAMNEIRINIIPLGNKLQPPKAYHKLISNIGYIAEQKNWLGKKVKLDFSMTGSTMNISGGSYHLNLRSMQFYCDIPDVHDENVCDNFESWAKNYELIILVCNAEELIMEFGLQLKVAHHRSLMEGINRIDDCLLMIDHAERVLDNAELKDDFFSSMMEIYSAFTPYPLGRTHLKKEYEMWHSVCSLYVAQNIICLKRVYDERTFELPANFLCHVDTIPLSGYMELVRFAMGRLFKDTDITFPNLTNNQIYNLIPIKNMCFNFFTSKPKEISLAIIGEASAGKTFFLQDFLQSLQKMGFNHKPVSTFKHRHVTEYNNDISDDNLNITQTLNYACRTDNIYEAVFEGERMNQKVKIKFLDIPGEIMRRENFEIFQIIANALKRHANKMYQVTTFVQGERKNKQTKKIVSFDRKIERIFENLKTDKNTNKNIPEGKRLLRYNSTEDLLESLKVQKYRISKSKFITGKELFENFFDYDTTSTINAIRDSVNALGLSEESANKFDQNGGKECFVFHYFVYNATDIVICNKCCLSGIEKSYDNANEDYTKMMYGLTALVGQRTKKPNTYFAFKSIDCIMDSNFFHDNYNGLQNRYEDQNWELDFYSKSVALIISQIMKKQGVTDADNDLSGMNDSQRAFNKDFTLPNKNKGFDNLRNYITDRLNQYKECFGLNLQNNELYQQTGIPPYVFFCASTIDINFTIHRIGADDTFPISVNSPANRFCFGTLPFAVSLLARHEIRIQNRPTSSLGLYMLGLDKA